MVAKTVLHNLASGIVVDRSVFVGLNSTDMGECIHALRAAAPKPVIVVDGAEGFFTAPNLISLIHANDPSYSVVNEALGGFFSAQQIDALIGAAVVAPKKAQAKAPVENDGDVIVDLGKKAPQQALGGYVFAQVPQGWSVGNNMSLGQTKVKRKMKNSDGDGTLLWMSPETFAKLWMFASKAWAGLDAPLTAKFNTGIGLKTATVQDDRIAIDGNYIRRYEIEQVAKYRGWEIPGVQKIAA